MGISVPAPGGAVHVHGYGFEYYPFPGMSDGRLKGLWPDGTPFSIDFLRDAYRAVALHKSIEKLQNTLLLLGSPLRTVSLKSLTNPCKSLTQNTPMVAKFFPATSSGL